MCFINEYTNDSFYQLKQTRLCCSNKQPQNFSSLKNVHHGALRGFAPLHSLIHAHRLTELPPRVWLQRVEEGLPAVLIKAVRARSGDFQMPTYRYWILLSVQGNPMENFKTGLDYMVYPVSLAAM